MEQFYTNLTKTGGSGQSSKYCSFGWRCALAVLTTVGFQTAQLTAQSTEQSSGFSGELGFQYSFPSMGTLVQLKAYTNGGDKAELAFKSAESRVAEIAQVLTDYDSKSEARVLTEAAFQRWEPVSDDLWAVLKASDDWYQRSGGAFDSSLGQLTRLWRKYRRQNSSGSRKRTPKKDELQQALGQTGWQHVQLDSAKQSVKFSRQGLRLDFGAIGKGFAVDQAARVLEQHGVTSYLVNISGNMRLGDAPPGKPGWRVQVAGVTEDSPPLRTLVMSNCAIATSGDLWQYIEIDGTRRSHILDPRTGIGVPGPIAATVVAPTAIAADALATIACVAAWEKIECILSKQEDVSVLVAKPKPATGTSSDSNEVAIQSLGPAF